MRSNRRLAAILTLASLTLLFQASRSFAYARNRHTVTLGDLLTLKYVDWHMDISPDGHTLAYVIDSDIWVVSINNPATHRKILQGMMPRWSPDGKHLAYYSRKSGALQLWIWDTKTGRTSQITAISGGITLDPAVESFGAGGDGLAFSWSPDGTKIVFTSRPPLISSQKLQPEHRIQSTASYRHKKPTHRLPAEPLVLTKTTPLAWTLYGLSLEPQDPETLREIRTTLYSVFCNQIFVVNVGSKSVDQLTHATVSSFNAAWSPDGREIVFVSTDNTADEGYGAKDSNLKLMDLASKRVMPLTLGPGQKRSPSWSSDGRWIAYLGNVQHRASFIWVVPSGGGKSSDVTVELNRNVFSYSWSPDSRTIVFSFQDGTSLPLARVRIATGEIERLSEPDIVRHPFTLSRSGTMIWMRNDGTTPQVLYQADSEGRNPRLVLNLNPQVNDWKLGEQEVVRWKNKRGDDLEGILIRPVDYQKGKVYPLIVDPYPGQVNGFYGTAMYGNQAFASKGYAVFFPNERTPHTWQDPVKAPDHNEAAMGPQGLDIMMDDMMTGVDNLIALGIVDPERMCLYGFSNGGGAVNQILTRTSRFKCAVSVSGACTDWAFSSFLYPGPFFPDLAGGATPWEDPDRYVKLSPVYHLDKVTTPVLLAVGDEEFPSVFPIIEMYNGLRSLHRDVTLLRYPRQGHGFSGAALTDYWGRVNAFFDSYLRPEQPRN